MARDSSRIEAYRAQRYAFDVLEGYHKGLARDPVTGLPSPTPSDVSTLAELWRMYHEAALHVRRILRIPDDGPPIRRRGPRKPRPSDDGQPGVQGHVAQPTVRPGSRSRQDSVDAGAMLPPDAAGPDSAGDGDGDGYADSDAASGQDAVES